MSPIVLFLAACGGIVVLGWGVSKITGARAFYVEDWPLDPGESVLWRDDAADVYLIPQLGQARVMSFARLHRSSVMVTNKRVVIGAKTLFGGKHMVQQVLHLAASPDGQTENLGVGLLTVGYQAIVIQPEIEPHLDEKKPYVDLLPASGHASSANLWRIRLFTDAGASFRLPASE
jgi:hypothetical protein